MTLPKMAKKASTAHRLMLKMRYASESQAVMALALGSVVCGEREVVKILDEALE